MGYFTENADRTCYEAMVVAVKEDGAKTVFERTVGDTELSLYEQNGRYVRISFIKNRGIVRVITTEEETLLTEVGDLNATGDTELILMNMDYSIQSHHDNGEGLIVKLADGSFLVYDGGYPTEMPGLLAYLEANTPEGQKPVIATWFLTHSHGDHYWGFESLLKSEDLKRVELQNVMLAIPTKEQFGGRNSEPFFTTKLPPMLEELGINLVIPFAGQVIRYPGMDMEVMLTVEDLMPVIPWDDNTASSVTFLRFKQQGRSVLVPGDSSSHALDMLTDMYGGYLKCDVLQNPHHGCSGATKAIFDCSDREEVIFCTAEDKYWERILTDIAWNHYLMNHLHVRRAYYADHGYQKIL
jgi:hypothetical protein